MPEPEAAEAALADRDLLADAARAAGAIALRHFCHAPEAWQKPGGAGPVSVADLEIDRMLRADLRAARPDYGWLSEETPDDALRLRHERVFVVDPLDGTSAFLAGDTGFSHALSVVERGRVTAAAVLQPARGRLYLAAAGAGATLNGAPLAVSLRQALDGAEVLAARPQLDPSLWPGGVPPVRRAYRPSLALRLCRVAEGRFDAMLTLRNTWEWDVSAGSLVVAEAGGRVSDRLGRVPCFNAATPRLAGFIAAGPAIHAALMRRLSGCAPPGAAGDGR